MYRRALAPVFCDLVSLGTVRVKATEEGTEVVLILRFFAEAKKRPTKVWPTLYRQTGGMAEMICRETYMNTGLTKRSLLLSSQNQGLC